MKTHIVIHVIAFVTVLSALTTGYAATENTNFTRLSQEDNAKLQALCHNPEFPAPNGSSQFKIFDGAHVPKGKYPWAVVIQKRWDHLDPWSQHCGGTLISRRHVLTATHCFEANAEFRILVGGVCAEVYDDAGCNNIDMVEAPMEFAAFVQPLIEGPDEAPNYDARDTNNDHDFAIIQLRDELKIQLDTPNSTTQAVCVAWPALELPSEMAIYGWGRTGNGRSSGHLMEVDVPLMTPQDPLVGKSKYCNEDRFFCQHLAGSNKGVAPGDSGSGVVARSGPVAYLFGSTLRVQLDLHVIIASRVQKQVIDLCYYVGYCVTRELVNKSMEELAKERHNVFNKYKYKFPE